MDWHKTVEENNTPRRKNRAPIGLGVLGFFEYREYDYIGIGNGPAHCQRGKIDGDNLYR